MAKSERMLSLSLNAISQTASATGFFGLAVFRCREKIELRLQLRLPGKQLSNDAWIRRIRRTVLDLKVFACRKALLFAVFLAPIIVPKEATDLWIQCPFTSHNKTRWIQIWIEEKIQRLSLRKLSIKRRKINNRGSFGAPQHITSAAKLTIFDILVQSTFWKVGYTVALMEDIKLAVWEIAKLECQYLSLLTAVFGLLGYRGSNGAQ